MKKQLLCLFAVCSQAFAAPDSYTPVTIEKGSVAPNFTLPGVDGKDHSLADHTGSKATAIIFTTNHCPDAFAAFPRIVGLVDQFKDQGVKFIAINSNAPEGLHLAELGFSIYDDSFADMKRLSVDEKLNLPYLYDGETQEVAKAYGAVATPHIFIFDADLKLRYDGRIDNGRRSRALTTDKNEARDALTSLLAGEEIKVTKTRPVGCSTKWKEKAAMVARRDQKWKENPVTVETIDAATISNLVANKDLSGFRLFNGWSTSCGPCVAEFPDLAEVYRQFSMQKLEFISISLDPAGSKDKVVDFLKDHECGLYPQMKSLIEKDGRTTNNFLFEGDTEDLAKALDAEWNGAMPHTLLVGENGKVLFRHTGVVDPVKLKKIIVGEVWAQAAE